MSFQTLQPAEVRELLIGPSRDRVMVVDVRDEDYVGGHIAGCVHFSVDHFESNEEIDAFLNKRILSNDRVDTVVVHCFKCEQRGPFCAKRLASRLQNMEREDPKVCIVSGGFNRFKQLFGEDPALVVTDDEEVGEAAAAAVKPPEACCNDFGRSAAAALCKPAMMA